MLGKHLFVFPILLNSTRTHTHTNLERMPYLGRVPSSGWKRACDFMSHPGMSKVGWGTKHGPTSLLILDSTDKFLNFSFFIASYGVGHLQISSIFNF